MCYILDLLIQAMIVGNCVFVFLSVFLSILQYPCPLGIGIQHKKKFSHANNVKKIELFETKNYKIHPGTSVKPRRENKCTSLPTITVLHQKVNYVRKITTGIYNHHKMVHSSHRKFRICQTL